ELRDGTKRPGAQFAQPLQCRLECFGLEGDMTHAGRHRMGWSTTDPFMAESDQFELGIRTPAGQLGDIAARSRQTQHGSDLVGHAMFDEMRGEPEALAEEGDCRFQVGNRKREMVEAYS